MRSALLPAVRPSLSVRECGAAGCYSCSACPILRHSESGPLGLSTRMWGRTVRQWSLPAPFFPHSASLGPVKATQVLSTRLPVSALPTLQTRRGWKEVLEVMKGKDLHSRLLYPAKLSFRMEGQIMCFPDKVKLEEFIITKPLLYEMLKGLILEKEEDQNYEQ